jgi:hypothetical protein
VGGESITAARGGLVGGESITAARGGLVGGESITAARGGLVGGESITAVRGGLVGGESITAARGGLVGGESVNARAEPATAQPATKAIRLTFIMFTPSELLICAVMWDTGIGLPALIKATPQREFPHIPVTMYA